MLSAKRERSSSGRGCAPGRAWSERATDVHPSGSYCLPVGQSPGRSTDSKLRGALGLGLAEITALTSLPGRRSARRAGLSLLCAASAIGGVFAYTPKSYAQNGDDPVTGSAIPTDFGGRSHGGFTSRRPDQGCSGDFWYSTPTPTAGDNITFGAADPAHLVLSYYWSFSDGFQSTSREVTRNFSTGGTRSVTLQVTDYALRTRVVTKSVTIAPPPPPPDVINLSRIDFAPGQGAVYAVAANRSEPQKAYLASAELGLVVLDASNPDAPKLTSSQAVPMGSAAVGGTWVTVDGNMAVVSDGSRPMQFIELAPQPAPPGWDGRPVVRSTVTISPRRTALRDSSALDGRRMLYYINLNGLGAVDALVATAPQVRTGVMFPSTALDLCVTNSGQWVYVALGGSGFAVVSASGALATQRTISTNGTACAVAVSGDDRFLYVGTSTGLQVYSLASPSNPTLLGFTTLGSETPTSIAFRNWQAVVCTASRTYEVDVLQPATPVVRYTRLVGGLSITPIDSALAGNALLARGNNATKVDIGGGEIEGLPAPRGSRSCIASNGQVSVVGSTAVAAVVVANSSTQPRVVSELPLTAYGAAMRGSAAYLANASGVTTFDLANPAMPVNLGTVPMSASDVCLGEGNVLFAAAGVAGVAMIPLQANGAPNPAAIAWIPTSGAASGVSYHSGRLVVATGAAGFSVYNVAGSVVTLAGASLPPAGGTGYRVATTASHAVLWTGSVAHLYDLATPASPRYLNQLATTVYGISASGGRFFIARGANGAEVWEQQQGQWQLAGNTGYVSSSVSTLTVSGGRLFTAEIAAPLVAYDLFAD